LAASTSGGVSWAETLGAAMLIGTGRTAVRKFLKAIEIHFRSQ